MPGKSRRGRGNYSLQSKKRKSRSHRPAMLAQQPAAAQTPESASSSKVPIPSASVPTPMVKPASARYPYIGTELRTIVVLAGVMLIVLVVLALVLS
jgi:hypothetical protein